MITGMDLFFYTHGISERSQRSPLPSKTSQLDKFKHVSIAMLLKLIDTACCYLMLLHRVPDNVLSLIFFPHNFYSLLLEVFGTFFYT